MRETLSWMSFKTAAVEVEESELPFRALYLYCTYNTWWHLGLGHLGQESCACIAG